LQIIYQPDLVGDTAHANDQPSSGVWKFGNGNVINYGKQSKKGKQIILTFLA
jgi:hypothetical protein